jgi:hypothetical protein
MKKEVSALSNTMYNSYNSSLWIVDEVGVSIEC